MDLVIYGAQGIALGTYKAVRELCPEKKILCFLVTERGNNASVLAGLPVRELSDFAAEMPQNEKYGVEVLIATPENVMSVIEKKLDEAGLYCHVRLDSERWANMVSKAFIREKKFTPLEIYPVGFHDTRLQVYMARFYKDYQLKGIYENSPYIIPIQVGAARCSERIAEVLDNTGDNISEKNANYSELTALYWMWKNQVIKDRNSDSNYYGLVHYRRVFLLGEDNIKRLADNDIDVVLPYPMPYEPNIEVHHERYLSSSEWNAVLVAVKELQPEYAEVFPDILKQEYLYNYNIIIARGSVLADYCSWLFPILERVEELCNPDGKQENRYIGYIAESLNTLYHMYNKNDLRIAHTGCKFMV